MFAVCRRSTDFPHRGLLLIAGILVILAAELFGCSGYSAKSLSEHDATTARRALAQGQLDEAKTALDRWMGARPDAAEPHYLKARLAWVRMDLDTVRQELSQAQQLGYPPATLSGLRGMLLAKYGQTADAELALQQAFNGCSTLDPEVAEALARLYLATFQLSRAAEVLERWRREVPDDARPYLLQTEIDVRSGVSSDVIIDHFRTAIQCDPELDRARLGLAEQLRLNHRNREAVPEYQAYLARKPDDPMGLLGAGLNVLDLGDETEAIILLDRALFLAPRDPVVLGARAVAEMRGNRLSDALAYLDRAIQNDPFDQANRYQRLLVLSRLGRKAEAEAERARCGTDSRRASDSLTRSAAAWSGIRLIWISGAQAALWLMKHGHEDEAVDWANLVLHAEPSDPAMNRLLADFYRQKGKLGLANFHEAHASVLPEPHSSTP